MILASGLRSERGYGVVLRVFDDASLYRPDLLTHVSAFEQRRGHDALGRQRLELVHVLLGRLARVEYRPWILGQQLVCDADLAIRARVEGNHDAIIIGRDAGVSSRGVNGVAGR